MGYIETPCLVVVVCNVVQGSLKGTRTTTDNPRTRTLIARVLKSLLHEFRTRTFPRKSYICLHFQLGSLTLHLARLAADPYVFVAAADNSTQKRRAMVHACVLPYFL